MRVKNLSIIVTGAGSAVEPAIGTPPEDVLLAENNGMPAIFIARSMEGLDVPIYRGDDTYGISLATNHLIGLGHRRIGIIKGPRSSPLTLDRVAGYQDALCQAGIAVERRRVPGRSTTSRSGIDRSQVS